MFTQYLIHKTTSTTPQHLSLLATLIEYFASTLQTAEIVVILHMLRTQGWATDLKFCQILESWFSAFVSLPLLEGGENFKKFHWNQISGNDKKFAIHHLPVSQLLDRLNGHMTHSSGYCAIHPFYQKHIQIYSISAIVLDLCEWDFHKKRWYALQVKQYNWLGNCSCIIRLISFNLHRDSGP